MRIARPSRAEGAGACKSRNARTQSGSQHARVLVGRRGAGARAEPAVLALELIFQIAQLYELRLTGLPAGRLHSRNRV